MTQTYIAILRGINVSGQKLIKMDHLKQLLLTIGFSHVTTYIQSGNIIFNYKTTPPTQVATMIQEAIAAKYTFNVPVIVLQSNTLKQIIQANPFLKTQPSGHPFYHVTILDNKPQAQLTKAIEEQNFLPDQYQIIDNIIYLYCPNGYGKTKLTNTFFENKLKVTATTRNWKTINQLLTIAENH